MKSTRSFFSYWLLLLIVFTMACHQPQNTKKFTIGFSQCTGGDAWRRQMKVAMEGELAFYPDMKLVYRDAENDSEKQVADIEAFIHDKVDLLIVSPNEATPITPIVEKAFNAGIPVIVVDRKTSSSMYNAYIGADNFEIGKLAGSYIADLLNEKGKVLEIWGLPGSTPAMDRHRGLWETLKEFPQIESVGNIYGKWEQDSARLQLTKAMTTLPDFDVLFAHNDVMAYGAFQVLQEFRPNNNIRFIGIDALPGPGAGIQFVDDKILTATFLYPTGGEESIRTAYQILSKQPYEKENVLHSTVVDARNVRVMKLQSDKLLNQQKDIVRQQQLLNEQIQTYYNQRILIYILLISLIALVIFGSIAAMSWREKNEINKRLEIKNQEILWQKDTIASMAEHAEHATQEKLRFFTNISHEFKTPLTLIMGPVEELLDEQNKGRASIRENLLLIKKNSLRLLRLINQLMDFRKIEDRKMIVKPSEHDLVQFIADIMAAFEKLAKKRKIQFQFQTDADVLYAWFDPDMLDKVIFNLLSNAFKFTNERGMIWLRLSVDTDHKNALLWVEDNGLGMSPQQVEHAFDRFYTGEGAGGTGIGLSLSREFMELHKGNLTLNSERGKGTRFCIVLPLGNMHFEEQLLVTSKVDWKHNTTFDFINEAVPLSENLTVETRLQKEHTLLLVDDNTELRKFLVNRLTHSYNMVEAADGTTGLHLAFEKVPDVIICDVMLPGIDGFQITKQLKEDLRTSHIPIILLTAKGSIEQRITGVRTGADEYISKPFVFEYLDARIKALIHNREALKSHYSHDFQVPALANPGQSLDRKFINDFTSLIEKNLGNADFHVNELARDLGMSRVQVYRKVKALIGHSINDYIVSIRLKKAKFLLLSTEKTISEIAFEVGFSSATYFSTAFKARFHQSPKEYKLLQKADSETEFKP